MAWVRLVRFTERPQELLAEICAVYYAAEPGMARVGRILRQGDTSPFEHVSFTFEASVSRVTLAQWTRHRVGWSYSVRSQRVTDASREAMVWPETVERLIEAQTPLGAAVHRHVEASRGLYEELRAAGVTREDARYILPQGVATHLFATCNITSLRHFAQERLRGGQWEIRWLAREMVRQAHAVCPVGFDDLVGSLESGEPAPAEGSGLPGRPDSPSRQE